MLEPGGGTKCTCPLEIQMNTSAKSDGEQRLHRPGRSEKFDDARLNSLGWGSRLSWAPTNHTPNFAGYPRAHDGCPQVRFRRCSVDGKVSADAYPAIRTSSIKC